MLHNLFDIQMGTILCKLTLKLVYNCMKTQMLILFMSFIIFYFPRPSGGPSINIRCPKLYGGAHNRLKIDVIVAWTTQLLSIFLEMTFSLQSPLGSIQKVATLAFEKNSEENCTFLEFRPMWVGTLQF